MCGGCHCREGFTGRRCECGGEGGSDSCKRDEEGEVCGGVGQCECGRCRCDERHVGENCECERDSVRSKIESKVKCRVAVHDGFKIGTRFCSNKACKIGQMLEQTKSV